MLNGHLDTVSLTTYADGAGLQPRTVDGRLYGRGAYDMKGGVAAIMLAAARAAEGELRRGDIVVALVADEEDVSGGTEEVLDHLRAEGIRIDAAVVPEPTDEVVMPAHRGFVWAEVTVRGVAAHGSRPDLGVDAIVKAGAFLTALGGLGERLAAGPRTPLLGTGSVHASLISGGAEVSSYPDACTVTLERRTVPGEDAAFVEAELREIVDELAARDPEFSAEVRVTFERPPFDAGEDSAVVPVVREAYAQVTGREAEVTGMQAWTDCALLAEAGIDAVLFGPVGAGAHAAEEWVSLDSLVTLSRVLERTVREFTA
jgi:acetylornithine deacetylase